MRIRKSLRLYIDKWLYTYNEVLGFTSLETPELIIDRKQMRQIMKERNLGLAKSLKRYTGVMWRQANVMYLDLEYYKKNPRSKKGLKNTIAHELCHKKYAGMRHGKQFDKLVKKTLVEGELLMKEKKAKTANVQLLDTVVV